MRPKGDFYTYRELIEALKELSEEQLDMTAAVYDTDTDEVIAVTETFIVSNMPLSRQQALAGYCDEEQPLLCIGSQVDTETNKVQPEETDVDDN
jgi:hypothetical protein